MTNYNPIPQGNHNHFRHLPIFKEILSKTEGPDLYEAVIACYEPIHKKVNKEQIRKQMFKGMMQ